MKFIVDIKSNSMKSENGVYIDLTLEKVGSPITEYYRHAFTKRDNSISFVGDKVTVLQAELLHYKGLPKPLIKVTTEEKNISEVELKGKQVLPLQMLPSQESQTVEIDLSKYETIESDYDSNYLLLKEGQEPIRVNYNNNQLGLFIVDRSNETIHYNSDYTIITYSEWKKQVEKEAKKNRENTLSSSGFRPYTFIKDLVTNRRGWKVLVINGEIWNEEENDDVKIINSKRLGNGGGRYRTDEYTLMVRENLEVESIYEGDIEDTSSTPTQSSAKHNPFAGLSDMINQ